MNNYTVLLLRPDYIADEFGKDTYLAHVQALDVEGAMRLGREEAWATDGVDISDFVGGPSDYHVLFTAMGHLRDLTKDRS